MTASGHQDARGVVFIDVLITMVFVLLLIGMAQTWARTSMFVQRTLQASMAADHDASLALALMAREIRDAGYDPTGMVAPIVDAGPQHLELTADLNGDGDVDDSFEHVTYAYRADRRQLTRASGKGSPQPFTDNIPPDGFRLEFRTADGLPIGDGVSALGAAEIEAVRRIDVRLQVETANPDPRASTPIRAEAMISVALRNR